MPRWPLFPSPGSYTRVMITLSRPHCFEEEIKRSRFIARAARLDDPEEAPLHLESLSEPEASHNCWAWKVGSTYRFSDDGEPGGTAGRPILSAIERQGLDHVLVVVTRYFGGTKLGAGGLVRAYGGAAARCLREAQHREVLPRVRLLVSVPFEHTGAIYDHLERHDATKQSEDWDEDGLRMVIDVVEAELPTLEQALRDATRGAVQITVPRG